MNKSHYTLQDEHPEDRIFKDKEFITRLSTVQEETFQRLVDDLGLNKRGDELLFDYIFNENDQIEFSEYLEKFGIKYEDYLK